MKLSKLAGPIALAVGSTPVLAQTLALERVADGLNWPLYATHAPGDPYRLYICERPGRIKILDLRDGSIVQFMDIDTRVAGNINSSTFFDGGLIGLVFDPEYQSNGFFYIHYIDNDKKGRISRFTRLTPDSADVNSELNLIFLDMPVTVGHRGGWLGFSPIDGYLYATVGDGSNGADSEGLAQTFDDPFGSILRIDLDGNDSTNGLYGIPDSNPFKDPAMGPPVPGMDELWAYGLRNPWRASFDRATGDLYIGDVGESRFEEVNVQPSTSIGGENYGWSCLEGDVPFITTGLCDPLPQGLVGPVHAYELLNEPFGCSITGGYVYRGAVIPEIEGAYFFADWCVDRVWSLRWDAAQPTTSTDLTEWTSELTPDAGMLSRIVSFAEDHFGELYMIRFDQAEGEVFRVVPAGGFVDCNANNVADASEIASGLLVDDDGDGIANSCEPCEGDADGNGEINFADLTSVLSNWLADYIASGEGSGPGDASGDGVVNFVDITTVLSRWQGACP